MWNVLDVVGRYTFGTLKSVIFIGLFAVVSAICSALLLMVAGTYLLCIGGFGAGVYMAIMGNEVAQQITGVAMAFTSWFGGLVLQFAVENPLELAKGYLKGVRNFWEDGTREIKSAFLYGELPEDMKPNIERSPYDASPLRRNAFPVWVVHLVGLLTMGVGNIAAAVLAYIRRREVDEASTYDHLNQSIKTFWWAAGMFAVIAVCSFALPETMTLQEKCLFVGLMFVPWVFVAVKSVKGAYRAYMCHAYSG